MEGETKFMLSKKIDLTQVPFERKLLYILILGIVPFFLCCIVQYARWVELDSLTLRMQDTLLQTKKKIEKEYNNKYIRKKFLCSDRFYIVKQLESYKPLMSERDSLQSLLAGGFHHDSLRYKKRLETLNSESNRISFAEHSVKNYSGVKETVEVLAHPVEVDREDIKVLLNRIEGVDLRVDDVIENRPHLLVSEFSLNRTKNVFQEVYQLKMKLLKREYLKTHDKTS